MLAAAILAAPGRGGLNLQGILVGNGAVATGDAYEGGLVQQRMQHAFNHGLFSPALKASIDAACTNWTVRSPSCTALLGAMADQMGPLNVYNIEQTCEEASPQLATTVSSARARRAAWARGLFTGAATAQDRMTPFGLAADPCTEAEDALTTYLNRADVQAALHVAAGAGALGGWAECASGAALAYTRIPQDERVSVYPGLLGSIAVLIFNGDQDECVAKWAG